MISCITLGAVLASASAVAVVWRHEYGGRSRTFARARAALQAANAYKSGKTTQDAATNYIMGLYNNGQLTTATAKKYLNMLKSRGRSGANR